MQHLLLLGFLPTPVDGWCDITDLFLEPYGVPAVGRAILLRTRQHINGWNDPPKQVRAIVCAVCFRARASPPFKPPSRPIATAAFFFTFAIPRSCHQTSRLETLFFT